MLRQKTLALVLAAACSSTMLYAAPFGSIFHKNVPTTTAENPTKVDVAFNNTSELPRQIKVGKKIKTLTSGKVTHLSIPVGTTVTVYTAMKSHNPGDVLLVVDASHSSESVTVD